MSNEIVAEYSDFIPKGIVCNDNNDGEILKVLSNGYPFAIILGDCREVLKLFPDGSIDCVITSPPYWDMRDYDVENVLINNLIGNEKTPEEFVNNICVVFKEIMRVLKPSGSVWLNIGDKYLNKNLMGMPWRVALSMQKDGWILRNDVIWDQMKGTQSAKDRLRDSYEHIFHFVKDRKYYYDYEKILIQHKKKPTNGENGKIVSATGVNGSKYRKMILNSKNLTDSEKKSALSALDKVLERVQNGELNDFRMTIRGEQRVFHSDNGNISGRAKELEKNGFFIITSSSKGFIPTDIWRIVPEDEWRTDAHYAVFPTKLLDAPIKATCPENGIILDPFMGIGSTIVAANKLKRRGIGIDISQKYSIVARKRLSNLSHTIDYFQD